MKRVVGVLIGVVALVGGLSAPAAAASLVITARTAATNLQPGSQVTVRVTGAPARGTIRIGQCADRVRCAPTRAVAADAAGAATVTLTVTGTATFLDGSRVVTKACRPDRCFVVAHAAGRPLAALPLRFVGEKVTATFTPTTGLVDGRLVTVAGRVRGAEGRTVRIAQAGTALLDTTVAGDGTFRTEVRVRRRPTAGVDCSPRSGNATPCVLAVSVVGDPSFGIASTTLRFLAAGPAATVTPRTGLLDGQVVRVAGPAAAPLAGRRVRVRQLACDTTNPFAESCTAGAPVTATLDAGGRLATSLTVRRTLGVEDCARTRFPVPDCSVEVTVLTAAGAPDPAVEATRAPVGFAPR